MVKENETFLKTENKPEAEALLQLLSKIPPERQRDILIFAQGMLLAVNGKSSPDESEPIAM